MEPFVLKTGEIFTITSWEKLWPNLVVGFTTKNGGFSNREYSSLNVGYHVGDTTELVCRNKQLIASRLQFPLNNWVAAEQTHGTKIKNISQADRGKGSFEYSDSILDTDGFYTSTNGILLTLCYADCVPLYFIDSATKKVGVLHAGWKGTVGLIGPKLIKKWQEDRVNPKDIHVAIGPSICEKCYIVDNYVLDFVQNILEDVEKKPYNQVNEGQYQLNLKELNKLLLLQAGIQESNISMTDLCTSCHSSLFFSHRRDQGKTGRMMSFIGWKENQ